MSYTAKIKKLLPSTYHGYVAFLFFLGLSAGLWAMNKLTKDYDASFEFRPKVKNSFTGASYTDDVDNTLYIKARSSGLFILRMYFNPGKIITIDVEDLKLDDDKPHLEIPVSMLLGKISENLEKDVDIKSVYPDTLYYSVSKNSVKKVPVTAEQNLAFGAEYRQSGPTILTPDSITVSGSREILDTVDRIVVSIEKSKNLTDTQEGVITIDRRDDLICRPRKINYRIPVERCTASSISIPIKTPDIPGLFLLTDNVRVKFTVPTKDFRNINVAGFKAVIDPEDVRNSIGGKALIKLEKSPDEAFDISCDPPFVEFIIQK